MIVKKKKKKPIAKSARKLLKTMKLKCLKSFRRCPAGKKIPEKCFSVIKESSISFQS